MKDERTVSAWEPISGERRFQLLVGSVGDHAISLLDPDGIVGSHFSNFCTGEDRAAGLRRPEHAGGRPVGPAALVGGRGDPRLDRRLAEMAQACDPGLKVPVLTGYAFRAMVRGMVGTPMAAR
ncbi:hypothetical protein ABMY26_36235 (plasmid) [Azospirillum sp. HJ39]|uniref:hypothetical protein n=1 Tax=Azospirillum sp. HJ39 TaxID=3159496 RepID=UPI003558CA78